MKKNILLLIFFCLQLANYAQVGINLENSLGVFHVDPQHNTTSATTGVDDDLLITPDGKVGIGTASPSNKLSIVTTGTDTGLHLPNGASGGKVLTSDIQGNGVWVSGAVQYQTMVAGTGNVVIYNSVPNGTGGGGTKMTLFHDILFDKTKAIYGSSYGWDDINQQYVAPVTGIYRIAFNIYFQSIKVGDNQRVYPFKNGSMLFDSGFVSVTDTGLDQTAFVMGLATLNKGDIIDFRCNLFYTTSTQVRVWASRGHTYFLIESL